jgi:ribosomal RNA assembly protein
MISMIKRISVPKERLAVLIGKYGAVKKEVEKRTDTRIEISDDVVVEGDGIGVLDAENFIRAVSRGFTPDQAMELIDSEKTLAVVQLPKDKNLLMRIRARIIGKEGKSRRNIERLTRTEIVVYGRTVGIIGNYENAEHAREAVEKLAKGSKHSNVFRYLEDLNARGKID